jgi:hypothetical protein
VKGYFTGNNPFKNAIQTAFIGAMASAAAYCIAKVFRAWFLLLLFAPWSCPGALLTALY